MCRKIKNGHIRKDLHFLLMDQSCVVPRRRFFMALCWLPNFLSRRDGTRLPSCLLQPNFCFCDLVYFCSCDLLTTSVFFLRSSRGWLRVDEGLLHGWIPTMTALLDEGGWLGSGVVVPKDIFLCSFSPVTLTCPVLALSEPRKLCVHARVEEGTEAGGGEGGR